MAIILDNQKALRAVRRLPFCYLCGNALDRTNRDDTDDHVPPTTLFQVADRDFPLVLPTHKSCNGGQSADDQIIGQLVGLLHGKRPDPKHSKLRFMANKSDNGSRNLIVSDFGLNRIIRRWVRGFHSALYQEYVPDEKFMTCPPLHEAKFVDGGIEPVPYADVMPRFVETLKRNRATNTLDRVVCRNGKCRYECVWAQADDGRWICIYGLDLYDWNNLGKIPDHNPRGCVGMYRRPTSGTPDGASRSTRLEFSVSNVEFLNPFGD